MEQIVYFDYCACVLLVTLLFTLIMRKMNRGHMGRRFLVLVLITLSACLAEIWADALDMIGPGNLVQKYIANTIYFLCHNFTIPFFIAYIIEVTDTWHIVRKNGILVTLLYLPGAVITAALTVNFFEPIIFYLDAEGCYARGDFILLLYAMAGIYLLFGVLFCIFFRKSMSTHRFITLMLVFCISLISVILQYFVPECKVELFGNALGLLIISMMVQRPEDLLDSETKLYKLTAYLSRMKVAYRNRKELEIILVNITNYGSLREMIGYEGISELLGKIAAILVKTDHRWKINADIYNLGNGKFRLVLGEKVFGKSAPVAEEINEKLKQDILIKFGSVGVTANICVVRVPEDITNLDSLMAFGDDLHTYPYTGNIMFASDTYKKKHYDIMRHIDSIIERAIADKHFEVYYQPIYSLKDQCFNSAEALLRLKDPQYGFVSPDLFIPAAEKSGAIHRIGSYVLEEVCRFIADEEFKQLGLDYIEVNLSVAQCMQKNLAEDVLNTLGKYGVRPEQINMEITETAVTYSYETLMDNLTRLTDAGISLSLDDFGTGYSNMRRIALLPFHIVKFDRTFSNAENTPNMLIVLKDTIKMIKDMNMEIVVEGIEDEKLLQMYSGLKCEYIQGYYYSKPIPREEFVVFIRNAIFGVSG